MKTVKALAVMTRPELEKAMEKMNVTRHDMHKLIELQRARIAELEAENGRLREAIDRWEEFASYLIRAEKNRAAYQGEDVLKLAAKHVAEILSDCRAQQPNPAQDKEQV